MAMGPVMLTSGWATAILTGGSTRAHLRPFLLTKQKPGEVRHLRARRVMVLVGRYAPSIGLVAACLCVHGLAKTLFRSPFSQNSGCPALGEHYRPHSQKTAQSRQTTGTTRRNLILGGSEASGLKRGARLSRSGVDSEAGWRACTGDAGTGAQPRGVLSNDFTTLFSASLDYRVAYTRSIVQSYYA